MAWINIPDSVTLPKLVRELNIRMQRRELTSPKGGIVARQRIAGNGEVQLGDAAGGVVGTMAVQLTGAWVATITPQARIAGTANPLVPIAYRTALEADANAGITTNTLFQVNAAGRAITLVVTGYASGEIIVDYMPLQG